MSRCLRQCASAASPSRGAQQLHQPPVGPYQLVVVRLRHRAALLEDECGVPHGDLVEHARDDRQRGVARQLHHPAVELARGLGQPPRLPSLPGSCSASISSSSSKSLRCAGLGQQAHGHRLDARPGDQTSAIVAPDSSSSSPAGRATISGPGTRTRAPVREPRRTSTSRSDSSTRTASRSVGRLTPKCAISSASLGRKSPSLSWPSTTIRRSVPATSSAVFGERIGATLARDGIRPDHGRQGRVACQRVSQDWSGRPVRSAGCATQ